jgi:tetratricopeptide (TPR) repeat protein
MLIYVSSPLAATRPNRAYEELQRKYEAALQEIERLRSELARLKGEQTAGSAPVAPQAEGAPSGDFLQIGNAHFLAQRYTEALAAYMRAIEAAPPMPEPISIAGWRTPSLAMCSRPMRI